MVCLTDLFGTCADIIGADLPKDGAEDSFGFLLSALGKPEVDRRKSLVNHSNHGEFAYRDGPWKLVFKMNGRNRNQSRGKPTIAELYNLQTDVGEKNDLARKHPEIVERMTEGLKTLIERGTSRADQEKRSNDTTVRFETTQTKRWAPGVD